MRTTVEILMAAAIVYLLLVPVDECDCESENDNYPLHIQAQHAGGHLTTFSRYQQKTFIIRARAVEDEGRLGRLRLRYNCSVWDNVTNSPLTLSGD